MELLVTSIGSIASAFIGAWFGALFAAKRSEKEQTELRRELIDTRNVLSTIAQRLPGGVGYAAVKQGETRIASEQE